MQKIDKLKLLEVTSDKLYVNSSSKKIDQNGLLSEVIFGPMKNYNCACGHLNLKTIHLGQVCPKCGVKCDHSDVRYVNFGKICLPFPVLRSTQKRHLRKLTRNFRSILNPRQNDLNSSLKIFLKYDKTKDLIFLSEEFNSEYSVPIKITGLYTIYIGLLAIKNKFKSESANKFLEMFFQDLLVVPPECRIVIQVDSENNKNRLIKHKLIDIYIEILRLRSYFLKDNSDYDEVVRNQYNKVNKLFLTPGNTKVIANEKAIIYDTFISKFQYYVDELYNEVANVLSGKSGLIRSDFLGKNIDFSARAVVVNDPRLKAYQIRLPKKMFFKLWLLEYYRFLKQDKYKDSWSNKSLTNMTKLLAPFEKSELNIDFDQYEFFDEFLEYFFSQESIKNKLVYLNRQPTLWKYGLMGIEVVGVNDSEVISVSPLLVDSYGMDFDGDCVGIYKVHDRKSKEELFHNSFSAFLNTYDHNPDIIYKITNEGVYSFEVLKSGEIDKNLNPILIQNIENLKFYYGVNTNAKVYINSLGEETTYGLALLNKWIKNTSLELKQHHSIKDAIKNIYRNSNSELDFHDKLQYFYSKLHWFLSTSSTEALSIPVRENAKVISILNNNKLLQKLPKNQYLGYHIHSAISDKVYDTLPKNYYLYKITRSKFRKISFIRSIISIGYIADNNNMVHPEPIKRNIISGLTEDDFFRSAFGTRKGIIDKDQHVPDAGYMQRSMIVNLSSLEVIEEDCETKFGFTIEIKNKLHSLSLINRYYFDESGEIKLYDLTQAENPDNIGKKIKFRSPITCNTPGFKLCRKCTGAYDFKSPYLGVLAGQYIEERITQLTMSSFHTSGSANLDINEEVKSYISDHLIDIETVDNTIYLLFDENIPDNIVSIFEDDPNYLYLKKESPTVLSFNEYDHQMENNDVNKLARIINDLLKTHKGVNIMPVNEIYDKMITALHSLNQIYSLFVELLFANSYVLKNGKILRYALNDGDNNVPVSMKYSIKKIHTSQSNVLSLIFEPNERSILQYYENPKIDEHLNIFEKIWLGEL